jgi:hypothetical protein
MATKGSSLWADRWIDPDADPDRSPMCPAQSVYGPEFILGLHIDQDHLVGHDLSEETALFRRGVHHYPIRSKAGSAAQPVFEFRHDLDLEAGLSKNSCNSGKRAGLEGGMDSDRKREGTDTFLQAGDVAQEPLSRVNQDRGAERCNYFFPRHPLDPEPPPTITERPGGQENLPPGRKAERRARPEHIRSPTTSSRGEMWVFRF